MNHPASQSPRSGSRTLATSAPIVTAVSPASGSTTGGTPVTITGSGFSGTTAVRFGSAAAASFAVVSDTQITAVTPAGTGTVQVTVTTPAGTSSQFVVYAYTTTSAPTLTSATPSSGPAAGGTSVSLTGTRFTGTTAVRFGSTPAASFTVVSDTHITAVAPAGSGTVQITVTGPGGTSNAVPYTYQAAPLVTALSPSQGPVNGGTTVTVTGSGFTGASAVLFGSVPATSFTVLSPTQLTAVTPPQTAGPVSVSVVTPAGTYTGGPVFFYLDAPVLTSISPSTGPTAGGTAVTLTGSHLIEATAVRFGTTPASSFTVVSDTQVTAVAPAEPAGTVQMTVTTAGGTSNAISYTYISGPVVTALSPTQGPTSGGTVVTVTGTGLTATSAVTFGTQPVPFTVISDSHLTAVAPPGPAGPVNVTVTTPGGNSTPSIYTRVAPPVI